ncbi:MAG: TolC family protein [Armatimonadota bacterium]
MRHGSIAFSLWLTATFAATLTRAGADPSLPLTEAVAQAKARNPVAAAARAEARAARRGLIVARSYPAAHLIYAPAITKGGALEELRISQPLEFGRTRASRIGVARAHVAEEEATAITEISALVYDAKSAYFALGESRALAQAHASAIEATTGFLETARKRVLSGVARPEDEALLQMYLEDLRMSAEEYAMSSRNAAVWLNTLMARSPQDPIGDLEPLSVVPMSMTQEEVIAKALHQSSSLRVDAARRSSFEQQAKQASSLDDLKVALHYRAEEVTRDIREQGFGVTFVLPLGSQKGTRAAADQKRALALSQQHRETATENAIRNDVITIMGELALLEQSLSEHKARIASRQHILQTLTRDFETGSGSAPALIEAHRAYLKASNDAIRFRARHARAKALLDRAMSETD